MKVNHTTVKIVSMLALASLCILTACWSTKKKQETGDSQSHSSMVQLSISSSQSKSTTTSASSVSETKESAQAVENRLGEMNIAELVQGNYATVSGSWVDASGNQLTFDEKGLVSDVYTGYGLSATDYGTASGGVYGGDTGGFLLEFIPAGVTIKSNEQFTDTSDSSRDRIWTGVGINTFAEQGQFYYRIEE
ncbi:hypothetical protein GGG87_01145 [Streptococcus sp. zg-86]|uniref:DUF6287 domain-containing protein n=1 Tax=Streptococcus zhangguiae TaxID=2664091 RepID=A0A6I4RF30_9STRE|nr:MULTISPECIES: DUF6287 domain-containing protein [unclassified Streptococcus]MTB63615.1 hypothetical protein [Streptococcus sp. zg-86]MTB89736.1 hypothetical protein [Streptococcus sp. zg-36]MWV55407.1 hypothetical protein [Streptococcus sp. zg-70]QTH47603.1 hypothetical protein J5M87_08690 [Streptococcus sp. zg-86]